MEPTPTDNHIIQADRAWQFMRVHEAVVEGQHRDREKAETVCGEFVCDAHSTDGPTRRRAIDMWNHRLAAEAGAATTTRGPSEAPTKSHPVYEPCDADECPPQVWDREGVRRHPVFIKWQAAASKALLLRQEPVCPPPEARRMGERPNDYKRRMRRLKARRLLREGMVNASEPHTTS